MKPARRAFTLVELLVVLAIFALLAALLFPVLASVREQGRKPACANNLHQLYGAFALYTEDHDRYLPPYDVRVSGEEMGPNGTAYVFRDESAALVASVQPYTHSADIWFCPGDPFARTASTAGNVRHQFLSYDYGGPFILYYKTPRTMDMTIHRTFVDLEPSDLTLLIDSSTLRTQPVAFYSHNGRFNTLYMDGHIKAENQYPA